MAWKKQTEKEKNRDIVQQLYCDMFGYFAGEKELQKWIKKCNGDFSSTNVMNVLCNKSIICSDTEFVVKK